MGHFVQYSEGVYVGYKYFETRHDTDPDYDYSADVAFPLRPRRYTTFEKDIMAMNVENGVVTVRVEVSNTGDRAGKDVLQLYFNPPLHRRGREVREPGGLQKTNLIEPGQTEHYSIEFNLEDMACYDAAVNKSYLLEKGDYHLPAQRFPHRRRQRNLHPGPGYLQRRVRRQALPPTWRPPPTSLTTPMARAF